MHMPTYVATFGCDCVRLCAPESWCVRMCARAHGRAEAGTSASSIPFYSLRPDPSVNLELILSGRLATILLPLPPPPQGYSHMRPHLFFFLSFTLLLMGRKLRSSCICREPFISPAFFFLKKIIYYIYSACMPEEDIRSQYRWL